MENILKGWVLSLIGLAGVIGTIAHYFGFYEFPRSGVMEKGYESLIALIVSGALFALPKTKIDTWIESASNKVVGSFTGKKDA